jgi:hypothetical protein
MFRCLLVLLAALVCIDANADTTVVARRGSVVSANDHAVVIARRGSLVHSSCGQYEGIGFSTLSPEHAKRSCCFYGQRTPVDIGVAWSPLRRGWFAVIRYR